MAMKITRRQWLAMVSAAGTAGVASGGRNLLADMASRGDAPEGVKVDGSGVEPCRLVEGEVIQPKKTLPTIHKTDVVVVGAGPAGVTAALGAARAGAKVALVERYGHFGGLSTGGLVLIILGHWVTGKKQVCRGIGEEMMQRLEKMPYGIVNRREGVNPTVDAEALKYLQVEMITEEGIDVFLHSWAVDAIMEDDTIRGVVFESKSGKQAILADQVIDTTGDGDIFASAGAQHERRLYHLGLPYRIGGLDEVDRKKAAGGRPPRHRGNITPIPGVNWVNMQGPDADALDVRELSRLELEHRKQIWKQVEELRSTPGYESVYLLETAPQLGVRISRVIDGVKTLTIEGVKQNRTFDDCVAIGGAWGGDHQSWQIPLGAMLPKNVENLLTAGRSLSGEPKMSDLIRVIPICWVSGHAAGCAAALAAREGCPVRKVDIPDLRKLLKSQGVYLG
jgi:hypothetical protein